MAHSAWWLGPQELKQKPPTEGLLAVLLVVVKYGVMIEAQELNTSGSDPNSDPCC